MREHEIDQFVVAPLGIGKPEPGMYPAEIASVIRRLSPLDKAKLYDDSTVPEGLNSEEKKLLRANIPVLRDEHRDSMAEFENFVCAAYEGRRGASAPPVSPRFVGLPGGCSPAPGWYDGRQ